MQEVRGSSPLISTNNLGHLGGLFFLLGKVTAGFYQKSISFILKATSAPGVGIRVSILPGGGMSMWPRLFLWLTITGRCLPGAFRLRSNEVSGL